MHRLFYENLSRQDRNSWFSSYETYRKIFNLKYRIIIALDKNSTRRKITEFAVRTIIWNANRVNGRKKMIEWERERESEGLYPRIYWSRDFAHFSLSHSTSAFWCVYGSIWLCTINNEYSEHFEGTFGMYEINTKKIYTSCNDLLWFWLWIGCFLCSSFPLCRSPLSLSYCLLPSSSTTICLITFTSQYIH